MIREDITGKLTARIKDLIDTKIRFEKSIEKINEELTLLNVLLDVMSYTPDGIIEKCSRKP